MAKKSNQKQQILINNVVVKPVTREALDIKKFRDAHKAAEGTSKNRRKLYEMYDDILLDERLTSVIEKRVNAITNLELKFFDKNNKEVEEMNPLIGSTYFEELLKEIIKSKLWGFSLCELNWSQQEDYANKTYSIDRRYVKPEMGIVTANMGDTTGVDYLQHPFALFSGSETDLGLLLKACAIVIYKRNNVADWANFNEIFGKPYPLGTYINDPTRELMVEAFDKAGFDSYLVVPEDGKIEMVQGSGGTGTSSDNFKAFREAMDQALTILILGQNLTTSVAEGSFAASKTHNDVEASLHAADRAFVIKTLNEKLKPILQLIGYNSDGAFEFVYMDEMPLEKRILIDSEVANIVPVDDNYFYETYGIPKAKGNVSKRSNTQGAQEPEKPKDEKLSFLDLFSGLFSKKKTLPF